MGCVDSKSSISIEERAIMIAEEELGYGNKYSRDVDFVHRKYSVSGLINAEQWRDISNSLLIKSENTPRNAKIEDFFSSFKSIDGKLPLRSLLIIGVLLSEGRASDKARLLFEIYDIKNQKSLPKSIIQALVDEMLDISINKLPILVCPHHVANEDEVKKYLKDLRGYQEVSKTAIIARFLGTGEGEEQEISLSVFVKNFEDGVTARLLTAHGLREFVYCQKPVRKSRDYLTKNDKKKAKDDGKDKKEEKTSSDSSDSSSSEDKKKKSKNQKNSEEVQPEQPAEKA
ncbi:unnamed protein product [Blepharisma stoltei]|uniref:Uncharacterized protein n=1 Tax=Blepharisma stoltei TaxID=1481888 RepID=A0AAU9JMX3_9CILI|nr:unnamed protein product [Blepharisma stoltei]